MSEEQPRKDVNLKSVTCSSMLLWTLTKIAQVSGRENGYGKLQGFFNEETGSIEIKNVLPLCPQKAEERSRADLTEDDLKKRNEQF